MPSVARNTATLLIASIAQKAIAFVYFALIARFSGVEDTGKYFFALSWTLLFSTVTDLGLTPVLIRESAKDQTAAERYLSQVITLKLPLMALAALLAVGGVFVFGYSPNTRLMVALASVVIMLDAVSLTFYGVLRGHHLLKYEGLGLVVGQTLTLVIGVAVLLLRQPLYLLIVALIVGSLYNATASWWIVWRRLRIRPRLTWDAAFIKTLFRTALPFALAGAFVKIYTSADVVLLTRLKGEAAAGLYSVPYKLTFAFQFIPMAFTAALYPAMSRLYAAERERLGELFEKGLRYLALIAAPIIAGIIALSGELIRFVYGPAYASSALPLQVLILTLVFIFLDFPVGSLLNATDRQTTQTKLMGLATLTSVVLNVLLIPPLGVLGVAIASLVSHAVLFFGGLAAVNRFLSWPRASFTAAFLRIAAAAAGMGLLVWLVKGAAPLVASIAAGAAAYPALALAFRASTVGEARRMIDAVLKRKPSIA